MLGFFESMLKLLKFQEIETDNFVFRLHYKVTITGDMAVSLSYIFLGHVSCSGSLLPDVDLHSILWKSY